MYLILLSWFEPWTNDIRSYHQLTLKKWKWKT
jgi:hypothetical protein